MKKGSSLFDGRFRHFFANLDEKNPLMRKVRYTAARDDDLSDEHDDVSLWCVRCSAPVAGFGLKLILPPFPSM